MPNLTLPHLRILHLLDKRLVVSAEDAFLLNVCEFASIKSWDLLRFHIFCLKILSRSKRFYEPLPSHWPPANLDQSQSLISLCILLLGSCCRLRWTESIEPTSVDNPSSTPFAQGDNNRKSREWFRFICQLTAFLSWMRKCLRDIQMSFFLFLYWNLELPVKFNSNQHLEECFNAFPQVDSFRLDDSVWLFNRLVQKCPFQSPSEAVKTFQAVSRDSIGLRARHDYGRFGNVYWPFNVCLDHGHCQIWEDDHIDQSWPPVSGLHLSLNEAINSFSLKTSYKSWTFVAWPEVSKSEFLF